MKPKITKIKLSKEELEEVDKLLKGEPVKKTKLVKNSMRAVCVQVAVILGLTTKLPIK